MLPSSVLRDTIAAPRGSGASLGYVSSFTHMARCLARPSIMAEFISAACATMAGALKLVPITAAATAWTTAIATIAPLRYSRRASSQREPRHPRCWLSMLCSATSSGTPHRISGETVTCQRSSRSPGFSRWLLRYPLIMKRLSCRPLRPWATFRHGSHTRASSLTSPAGYRRVPGRPG